MTSNASRRAPILAWLLAWSLYLFGCTAWAQQEPNRQADFDIAAQPMSSALVQFGKQSGLQVISSDKDVGGVSARAVKGRMNVRDAINQLVEGTGLIASFNSTETVVVKRRAAPTSSGAPAAAAGVGDTIRLEPILVTAQKREERLKDVPISISVITGDQLDRSTVQGVSEALSRVPGVATPVALQGGGTQLSIRGVSAANPVFTGSGAVAYYLDTVPFALVKHAIAPDVDAYDLERVEVLRGPQGTLYGAGSLNGVVRILTHEADLSSFELKGRTLVSNTTYGGMNARADMAVNLPLIADKLAARVVLSYSNLSGWIDKPIRPDANDAEMLNMRLKLNAQPTDKLSIGFSAWASRSDIGAPSFSGDNRTYSSQIAEPIKTDYDVYGLKIAYDFPGFRATSATSYLDYSSDSFLDQTASGIQNYILQTQFRAKTFAEEINLTSEGRGPWRWTLGGIYRDSEDVTYQNGNQFFVVPQEDTYQSKSYAAFGELTGRFGELEVTGGLRYFKDKLTQVENQLFNGRPPAGEYANVTFDNTSPRAVVNWKPNDASIFYASYSEGFRSGSHHTPTIVATNPSFQPVEPDTLRNYEVGTKGTFLDGSLVLDAAAFYIDWKDVQQTLRVPITNTVILSTLINAGSASGPGAEFAIAARPAKGLNLYASVSWNDLRFDSDVLSGGLVLFAKGDRLNFSPEWTAGLSGDYTFPITDGYTGRLAAFVNYTSRMIARRPSGARILVADGDPLLIGRMSFSVDTGDRWSATLFVNNVNDEQGAVVNNWLGTAEWDMRIRPRTYGLQLEYRF